MNIQPIYQKIWEKARPLYEKGRPMDIAHIEWFMAEAVRICEVEKLDDSLLLPLAILHDIGYSKVKDVETANYYQGDIRKLHMAEGAKMGLDILAAVHYDPAKSAKIAHYISVHDNWAFGEVDIYTSDPVLGTFKDLDYIWIYTKVGCANIQPVLKKTDAEMIEHLRKEVSPIGGKKPFSNPSTKKLHDDLLAEREVEFGEKLKNKER